MIRKRIEELRRLMAENGIHAYIIVTSDYHGSEYVGGYFKEREYMSGFTGSAGTLAVTLDKAALWTDGRYFLQADEQLAGSGIRLMKQGTEGTPDIETYILDGLSQGECIGFDGRTVSAMFARRLAGEASARGIRIKADIDLPGMIWSDRPEPAGNPVWELGNEYTGMTRAEKLKKVREHMKKSGADVFVLSSIDDIAWLLNLRGSDVECNPVFLSYMIIFHEKAYLYADRGCFDDRIRAALAEDAVEMRSYNDVYSNISALAVKNILLDETKVNYAIINSIADDKNIINEINPTTLLKAVKTSAETENMRRAHIKDGVAVTRFMYWLKKSVGKEVITELTGAEKLEEYRRQQDGYIEPSFAPIFAYGEHGAIVHYSATKETNAELSPNGFLLADTGGQYMEGTTDITRTFALGGLTDEQRKMYTLVLVGNLRLAAAKFMYGVRGVNLDILAREALWEEGLDYNHGTGHGVGYLLNVHEGPNRIAWKIPADRVNSAVFEEGMITSDEPGIYIEGGYGVRLENLTVCKKLEKNAYGQFMGFETLTLVPFDLDAVDTRYMSSRDIRLLNEYHSRVYEALSPYIGGEELAWLAEATRAV